MNGRDLARATAAEALGSALLVAAIVGSGVMGERLAGGNAAIVLLANSLATGAALVALLLTLGPVSGAHLNPLVTVAELVLRRMRARDAVAYVLAQFVGALCGTLLAHAMFELPLWQISENARSGLGLWIGEIVATAGLLCVVLIGARRRPKDLPYAVAAFITAGYWFTSSTSFANPAVTLARCATDTFVGIRPRDVAPFVVAQALGAALAIVLASSLAPLHPRTASTARDGAA